MALVWREGVFAASVDGRTVVLDVRTGRYHAFSSRCDHALAAVRLGVQPTDAQRDTLSAPLACGLLGEGAAYTCAERLTPPDSDLTSAERTPPTTSDIILACAAQLAARLLLATVGFGGAYRALNRSRRRSRPEAFDARGDALRLARAVELSEVVFARRDKCLARSLALRLLSLLYGFEAVLVLGVRIPPFAAHSWVERDGCVLNDSLEEVRCYSAILAI